MKIILTKKNDEIFVDDDDYVCLSKLKWHVSNKGYAVRGAKNKIFMHKIINKTPKGWITDHVNGNKLDNRKSNLRTCSLSQNNSNKGKYNIKKMGACYSKFKGVYAYKKNKKGDKVYLAKINFDYKVFYLGCFSSEEEAAVAYNKKAIEIHGEYAYLNTL